MLISIHQPEFMPWAGFFDKIAMAEQFVILDSVQFQKGYFHNRCRIKQKGQAHWLTVPVVKDSLDTVISEIRVHDAPNWGKKCYKSFQFHYCNAPFWQDHEAFLRRTFCELHWERLVDLNLSILEYLCGYLELPFRYLRSSELALSSSGSDLVLDICRRCAATNYLSGAHGREYLDVSAFAKAGVQVTFQEYQPVAYSQFNGPYVGPLSIIDLLLNHGPGGKAILLEGRATRCA